MRSVSIAAVSALSTGVFPAFATGSPTARQRAHQMKFELEK